MSFISAIQHSSVVWSSTQFDDITTKTISLNCAKKIKDLHASMTSSSEMYTHACTEHSNQKYILNNCYDVITAHKPSSIAFELHNT